MRIDLQLGKHRKARVWLNELPEAKAEKEKVSTFRVDASGTAIKSLRLAGLELLIPLGPRTMYDLVGGSLAPGDNDRLIVSVSITETAGKIFRENIAMAYEKVYVGLPDEYAQAVERAVRVAGKHVDLPAGRLVIDHAAHGEVSSNRRIFEHLTVCGSEARPQTSQGHEGKRLECKITRICLMERRTAAAQWFPSAAQGAENPCLQPKCPILSDLMNRTILSLSCLHPLLVCRARSVNHPRSWRYCRSAADGPTALGSGTIFSRSSDRHPSQKQVVEATQS